VLVVVFTSQLLSIYFSMREEEKTEMKMLFLLLVSRLAF
jgi:hypothetical protein